MIADGRAALLLLVLLSAAVLPWLAREGGRRGRARQLGDDHGRSDVRVVALDAGPVELRVLLDLLGAAVRAGASLPRAFEAVGGAIGGDDGAALRIAGSALVLGAPWDEAWEECPDRMLVVADSLRATWESGVSPRGALRTARDELARGARARVREASARLGVRLVLPLGACFLPAFVLVGIVPILMSLGSGVLGDG